ncbi:hypothetical protein LTR50_002651 [Elasticomyces elasticus]|nr:hypothetical protein LTR50_002651 [Elasticomyces elasticus]
MPPVAIYTDAPITATKADGVTPKTAEVANTITKNIISTTMNGAFSPTSAQPGAAAMPAPTGTVQAPAPQPLPFPSALQSPTRTTQDKYSPPPPQPGAVPIPPGHTRTSSGAILPPPPRAGETPRAMPPQMYIPPPTANAAPTHSTIPTSPTLRSVGAAIPTTISYGALPISPTSPTSHPYPAAPAPAPTSQYSSPRTSFHESQTTGLGHPSGYVQNPYAAEMTAEQRARQAAVVAAEHRRSTSLDGILGRGAVDGLAVQEDEEGIWGSVKGWAKSAGKRASVIEEEIWKRVNGEK